MVNVPPRETNAAVNNGDWREMVQDVRMLGGLSGHIHKKETPGMKVACNIDKSSLLLYFHGAW